MRKSSLTLLAAAIGLAASQASAADLPRKAPPAYIPPAPPPITWTGCYIGANVGGAFGRLKAEVGDLGEFSEDRSGFAGGGQIGCDYQWAGTGWVIGFRNMFDGTSIKKDLTLPAIGGPFDGDTLTLKAQWFDTLTGRIGYAVAPAWLIYGQGGVAWGHAQAEINGFSGFNNFCGNFNCDFSTSKTRTGWTAGGGVEWMFAPHWSAFLEGNYMDFGNDNHTIFTNFANTPNCNSGCTFNTKFTAATVLVGVNYRFW